MNLSHVLRVSAVLWAIWGLFHLSLLGIIVLLSQEHPVGAFQAVPEVVGFDMFGMANRLAVIASLKQHAFNLGWIGAAVTVGSVFVWKKNVNAIFFCALLGGFADLGYFLFVDLPGFADPPGPQMTYICVAAIASSFYVYFKSDKLKAL